MCPAPYPHGRKLSESSARHSRDFAPILVHDRSRPPPPRSRPFRTVGDRAARARARDDPDRKRLRRSGRARSLDRDLRDQGRPAQRRPRRRARLDRSGLSRAPAEGRHAGDRANSAMPAARASTSSRSRTRPQRHNMVVCTLCSCYPWPVLGLPPVWYKSAPYRSRAVNDPRGVLARFRRDAARGHRESASGIRPPKFATSCCRCAPRAPKAGARSSSPTSSPATA